MVSWCTQDLETPLLPDVHEYLESEHYIEPKFSVRMRFAAEAALIALDDRVMWDLMEASTDGSVVVTFAAPDLEWASRLVLSYGTQVTVLEPEGNVTADLVAIREAVQDPTTAELLSPRDHPYGSKRPPIDTDYYVTYNRPNVTLVDARSLDRFEFVRIRYTVDQGRLRSVTQRNFRLFVGFNVLCSVDSSIQ